MVHAVSQMPANSLRLIGCLFERPIKRTGVSIRIEKRKPNGKKRQSSVGDIFWSAPTTAALWILLSNEVSTESGSDRVSTSQRSDVDYCGPVATALGTDLMP
jgi:hypothetical protein